MTAAPDSNAPDALDAARQMWSTGSYATMGDVFAAAGRDLVASLDVAGRTVLDVACGTGNTSLAAAAAGAQRVTGVDLTPALLAEAGRRAEERGLEDQVEWHEADMAELPVPDDAYDVVLSTFGAMFATDQRRVAEELRRACRPGGTVAVTAWTIDGTFDQMSAALRALVPDAPPPGPGPRDWARADALVVMFGLSAAELVVDEREVRWRVPSAEHAATIVERNAGSVIQAREAMGAGWPTAHQVVVDVFAAAARPVPDSTDVEIPLPYTVATFTEPGLRSD